MRCVREGRNRAAFIADLEAAALTFLSDSAPLLEDPTPDRYFAALDTLIIRCALKYFRKGAKAPNVELEKRAEDRLALLRERRLIREKLGDAADEELKAVVEKLDLATKEARLIRRRIFWECKHSMIDELWDPL